MFSGLLCRTTHLDKGNFAKKYFRIWQNSKSYHITKTSEKKTCIATSSIQLIIYEFSQAMYLYICRVSQITPRARENFIASRRTWNFSHHFKILLYHCTHRLIRETKGKLWTFSYSFKKTQKNKENKSEELLSKHHSQIMITTESLFNIGYIITYTKK